MCVKQRWARLKCQGALFTCFTTCAIHLDVVEGLETLIVSSAGNKDL